MSSRRDRYYHPHQEKNDTHEIFNTKKKGKEQVKKTEYFLNKYGVEFMNFKEKHVGKDLDVVYEGLQKLCKYNTLVPLNYVRYKIINECPLHSGYGREHGCEELCKDFEPFESNKYLYRQESFIIISTEENLKSRKKIDKQNRKDFVKFLLSIFRKRQLSYAEISEIFGISFNTCVLIISQMFRECCLEKENCVYKDVFEGKKNDTV